MVLCFLTKRPKEQANSTAVIDTNAKDLKNWTTKLRKCQAAYMKYDFTALQKTGHDDQHVRWWYSFSKQLTITEANSK